MKDTVKITIRIDKDLKESAEKVCAKLGIDMNTAINIFLCRLVNKEGIPFPVSIGHSGVITDSLPDKFKAGPLLARYDAESGKAYLEFPDGSREYI